MKDYFPIFIYFRLSSLNFTSFWSFSIEFNSSQCFLIASTSCYAECPVPWLRRHEIYDTTQILSRLQPHASRQVEGWITMSDDLMGRPAAKCWAFQPIEQGAEIQIQIHKFLLQFCSYWHNVLSMLIISQKC